jgi:hypothetical protein
VSAVGQQEIGIMANDTQSPHEIAFAQLIGQRYGKRLTAWPSPFRGVFRREPVPRARRLLSQLIDEINRDLGPPEHDRFAERAKQRGTQLNASASIDLTAYITDALRLIGFWAQIGLDGVLVWHGRRQQDNGLNEPALFDVFNPLARRMLYGRDNEDDFVGNGFDSSAIREWARIAATRFSDQLAIVPPATASRGFLTLFTDSLRSTVRSQRNANTSYVDYTVHSGSGYQLEYYPQFNATPLVFGGTPTSPVSQRVLIGRYRFQGWLNGKLTTDGGTYLASPNTPSATLRDF